jgi:signal transduction histidine kinase
MQQDTVSRPAAWKGTSGIDTLQRQINLFVAVLVIGSGALIFALLYFLHEDAQRTGQQQITSLVRVLEEQTSRTLQTVDVNFQLAAARLSEMKAAGRLDADSARGLLQHQLSELPFLRAMWVLDAQGRVRFESQEGNGGGDFSDREYFRDHLAAPRTGLRVATPTRSRINGAWFLGLTRRLSAPDGSFDGVIVAALEPSYFDQLWSTIDLREGGVVAMLRRDGVMLMRSPQQESALGQHYGDTPLFTTHLVRAPNGTYDMVSRVDGQERHYAYRLLSAYPDLVVLVGQPRGQFLAVWTRVAGMTTAIWLAGMAVVAVLASLLKAEWRRRWADESKYRDVAQALAESEGQLRRRVAQLQAIYDGAPVALGFVDRALRFIDVNERLALLNGRPSDAHRDRPVHEVLAHLGPELGGRIESFYRDAIASGAPIENIEFTQEATEPGGRRRYWLNSFHPVRSAGGEVIGASSVVLEITDQRHAEDARRKLEDQLHQVQKLESIGQLTGGIAHDFNNLLTVILGNAELMVEQLAADDPLRMLAEMTRDAAVRGSDLTHRLLAFARRQALDPKSLDVNQLLSLMDGLLRRTVREDIEIELVRGAGLWTALVDPSQLEAAVLNLAINARDAMPAGGRLTVETANARLDDEYAGQHPDVRAGQYVMVAVSDTGQGIAPQNLARVFEPFFTTKAVGKGTGLGLSMVWGFIKQSRGHVQIYSELGHGTTVKMYLPRSMEDAAGADASVTAPADLQGAETILLVEDDELVLRYARDQLLSLGYQVIEARDGPEALRVVQSRPDIDLLLTDIVMPGGMNGRQLADAARAQRPDLKVLFSSGYTENAIVHHGRLDPGVHLLNKPYRRIDLARKVRLVLSLSS